MPPRKESVGVVDCGSVASAIGEANYEGVIAVDFFSMSRRTYPKLRGQHQSKKARHILFNIYE